MKVPLSHSEFVQETLGNFAAPQGVAQTQLPQQLAMPTAARLESVEMTGSSPGVRMSLCSGGALAFLVAFPSRTISE